jgi:hypothetical protein
MPLIRTISAALVIPAVLACAVISEAADSAKLPFRVVYRGAITLPQTARDSRGNEVEITGLSGITWLGHDRYAAIMDNSDKLILFSLKLARDGTPEEATDIEVVTLTEPHDYEDIVACPEPLQRRIAARRMEQGFPDPGRCALVCEEDTPAIRTVSLTDGSLLGVIPIPEVFSARRLNRGLESLDIEPDGLHIWTANEEALPADGASATAFAGTVVRLARIATPEPNDKALQSPTQFAYATDPPHSFIRVFSGEPLSGIVSVVILGDGLLLVLERSGCPGLPPFENRIYGVNTKDETDVTTIQQGLADGVDRHVGKVLLWKDQLGCNLEGLCLGPSLGVTRKSLLAIADNNGAGTPNVVVGFTLENAHGGMQFPAIIGVASIVAASIGLVIYWLARA